MSVWMESTRFLVNYLELPAPTPFSVMQSDGNKLVSNSDLG